VKRTYVSELDDRLVVEAAKQTHSFWSGGRTLEAHIESQRAQLRRAGRAILRYTGLVDETGLVASIKRYGLSVHVPGFGRASAVGVGAVFTRFDSRGTGAATQLLRAVLEEARASGDVLALLYSDIDPAFYERLGFVPLAALEHSAPVAELPDGDALDLRPATAEDDPWMLETYDASWDPAFLRPSRTVEIFRYFRFRTRTDAASILSRGGRDVGYVLAAVHDEPRDDGLTPPPRTLFVDEWVAPGVDLADVLGALRRMAEREGARAITSWLPPHLSGPPFVARTRTAEIAMVCPFGGPLGAVDPERAFFGSLDHF
jgi:GNAT superfamily N-acetyltransferase